MAVAKKQIIISAVSVIDEVEVAKFGALMDPETKAVSFNRRVLDDEAYKANRVIVMRDQMEFEDMAYGLQDGE